MDNFHPTAIIDTNASIASDCRIGPYCVVEEGAVLGAGCRLDSHVVIKRRTELGERVKVFSGAVLGGDPQDLSFDPEMCSKVVIGNDCTLREGVTVNRSLTQNGVTRLGERVYMMAFSHAAHDCAIGDRAVLANAALLAGHVSLGAHAFVGGGGAVHQFCRIGEGVMIGGHSSITKDVPPGISVVDRNHVLGLNLVGLKRRGYSAEEINEFKRVFRELYSEPGRIRDRARRRLEANPEAPVLIRRFLEFFQEGTRGFVTG